MTVFETVTVSVANNFQMKVLAAEAAAKSSYKNHHLKIICY